MACGGQHAAGKVLRLDVGGKVFEVPVEVLARFPKSQLASMCADCPDALNREAPLPVQRSNKGFEVILDIFRQGTFDWAQVEGDYTLMELRSDLGFYGLPKWEDLCPHPVGKKFMQARTGLIFCDLAEEMIDHLQHLCNADLVKRQADFLLYWGTQQELEVHRFTCREDFETSRWYRQQQHNLDIWHFRTESGDSDDTCPTEEIELVNANRSFRVAVLELAAQEMMVATLAKRGFQAECRMQEVLCDSEELPGETPTGRIQLVTIHW